MSELDAGPGQVGLLAALSTLAFLLVGLPAGAWVDRLRRRRVQVAADLGRAALLGSVPLAWALDRLTLTQLYAVVLAAGVGTVFFDVAAQSYLPHVVGRPALVEANSRLAAVDAANQVAGRGVGGYLVQLVAAPAAVAVNALTHLCSAVLLLRISRPEPPVARRPDAHLGREIAAGLRFVGRHPLLRPIAAAGALTNFSVQLSVTMLPVLFVRELGLSPGVLGLYLAGGGLGVLLGTTLARRIGRQLGFGRATWVVGLASAPVKLLIPLLDRGPMLWVAGAAWLLTTAQVGVNNVLQVSLRQRATPDALLGRMNATMRFLLTGAVATGAVAAGLLGELAGVRAALWVGAVGLALVWVPAYLSPLRTLRELPDQVETTS